MSEALDLKIGTCVAHCRFSTGCSALSQISNLRVCEQCMGQHEGRYCGLFITDADEVWLGEEGTENSQMHNVGTNIQNWGSEIFNFKGLSVPVW